MTNIVFDSSSSGGPFSKTNQLCKLEVAYEITDSAHCFFLYLVLNYIMALVKRGSSSTSKKSISSLLQAGLKIKTRDK